MCGVCGVCGVCGAVYTHADALIHIVAPIRRESFGKKNPKKMHQSSSFFSTNRFHKVPVDLITVGFHGVVGVALSLSKMINKNKTHTHKKIKQKNNDALENVVDGFGFD